MIELLGAPVKQNLARTHKLAARFMIGDYEAWLVSQETGMTRTRVVVEGRVVGARQAVTEYG